MSYGCLAPGHRVLTTDMRWIPAEDLLPGDSVMGFDAERPGNGSRRQIYPTRVTANSLQRAPVYRLRLSDGTAIEASEEHPFLIRRGGPYQWYTVKQMYDWMYYSQGENTHRPDRNGERNDNPPIKFPRFVPTWKTLDSYQAGYLAGFFDADGNLNQARKTRRGKGQEHILRLSISQNPNIALDEVLNILDEMNVPHAV